MPLDTLLHTHTHGPVPEENSPTHNHEEEGFAQTRSALSQRRLLDPVEWPA